MAFFEFFVSAVYISFVSNENKVLFLKNFEILPPLLIGVPERPIFGPKKLIPKELLRNT